MTLVVRISGFPTLNRSPFKRLTFTNEGNIIRVTPTTTTDKLSACCSRRIVVFRKILAHGTRGPDPEKRSIATELLEARRLVDAPADKLRSRGKRIEYKLSFETPCTTLLQYTKRTHVHFFPFAAGIP